MWVFWCTPSIDTANSKCIYLIHPLASYPSLLSYPYMLCCECFSALALIATHYVILLLLCSCFRLRPIHFHRFELQWLGRSGSIYCADGHFLLHDVRRRVLPHQRQVRESKVDRGQIHQVSFQMYHGKQQGFTHPIQRHRNEISSSRRSSR